MLRKTKIRQRHLPLPIEKSNDLVRSQVRIGQNDLAMRLFLTAIKNLTADGFPIVEFNSTELELKSSENHYGGSQYKLIEKAVITAGEASIVSTKQSKRFIDIQRIFSRITYNEGHIKAIFDDGLRPHLLALKDHFTVLNFFDVISLPSGYSKRLYEILKSWHKPHGVFDCDIEDIYEMLDIPTSKRNDFNYFKTKAIEKAQADFENTELRFTWIVLEREKRKIKKLRFMIAYGDEEIQRLNAIEFQRTKKDAHSESAQRKRILNNASACRRRHGIKPNDPEQSICTSMDQKREICRYCRDYAEIKKAPVTVGGPGRLFD